MGFSDLPWPGNKGHFSVRKGIFPNAVFKISLDAHGFDQLSVM